MLIIISLCCGGDLAHRHTGKRVEVGTHDPYTMREASMMKRM